MSIIRSAAIVAALAAHAAAGPTFTFTRLIDTTAQAPGGLGPFVSLSQPTINGGVIAFHGGVEPIFPYGGEGVFIIDAPFKVHTIADPSTPYPGGVGHIIQYSLPAPDSNGGAFSGFGINDQQGVFSYDSLGALTLIAGRGSQRPGSTAIITDVFTVARSGGDHAFIALDNSGDRVLYGTNDGLHAIASRSTPIPDGSGLFQTFGYNVSTHNGEVAFVGNGLFSQTGVYCGTRNNLRRIADASTPIPGAPTLTFNRFADQPSIYAGAVAFHAASVTTTPFSITREGIYTRINGLKAVADTQTLIPGGSGNFLRFGSVLNGYTGMTLNRGTVVFYGQGSNQQVGIYTNAGGILSKVVARGDTLDGQIVTTAAIAHPALAGNTIALVVGFESNIVAIYRVDIHACRPDVNDDGHVNVNDFITFLSLFAAANPRADFDDSGNLTVNDFIAYLNSAAVGCPE